MIDRGTFNNEWTYLCERFRMTGEKEPSSVMRGRYYEYLSARMDTAAFVEAAGRIYCEAEFFPKPSDFAPEGNAKRAALAWEKVLPLLRNSSSPLDSLDEPAKRAVRTMGGLAVIGQDASAIHFRRSEFCELYEQYAGSSESPPPLTGEGRRVVEQAMAGGTSGGVERSGTPGRLPATRGA